MSGDELEDGEEDRMKGEVGMKSFFKNMFTYCAICTSDLLNKY